MMNGWLETVVGPVAPNQGRFGRRRASNPLQNISDTMVGQTYCQTLRVNLQLLMLHSLLRRLSVEPQAAAVSRGN